MPLGVGGGYENLKTKAKLAYLFQGIQKIQTKNVHNVCIRWTKNQNKQKQINK